MKTLLIPWIAFVLTGLSTSRGDPGESPKIIERRYDVRGLLKPFMNTKRSIQALGKLRFVWDSGEDTLDPSPNFGLSGEMQEDHLGKPDFLMEFLNFLPGWQDEGDLHLEDGILRVVQPPAVQDRVAAFLEEFQRRNFLRLEIEFLQVPADVLKASAPGWQARAPFLDGPTFQKLLGNPRALLYTRVAREGQTVGFGFRERRSFLHDYEVNQCGVIPVINPSMKTITGGDWMEVRAHSAAGRGAVRLDYGIITCTLGSRREKICDIFGELELPRVQEAVLWSTAVVPAGKVLLAGCIPGSSTQENLAFLIRVKPFGQGNPEDPSSPGDKAGSVRIYDIPPGCYPPLGIPPGEILEQFTPHEEQKEWSFDLFRERLENEAERQRLQEDFKIFPLPGNTAMAVAGSKSSHAFLEEFLRHRQALPRLAVIDLQLLTLPRPEYVALRATLEDGILLPRGLEAELSSQGTSLRSTVTGFTGQVISFRRSSSEDVVTDIEMVSGGTGFAIMEVPDPVVRQVASGLDFQVRASQVPGSDLVELECNGMGAETDTSSKQEVILPWSYISKDVSTQSKSTDPASGRDSGSLLKVQLTVPRQELKTWRAHVKIPAGRQAILDASTPLGDPKGKSVLLLVGSVRIVTPE